MSYATFVLQWLDSLFPGFYKVSITRIWTVNDIKIKFEFHKLDVNIYCYIDQKRAELQIPLQIT